MNLRSRLTKLEHDPRYSPPPPQLCFISANDDLPELEAIYQMQHQADIAKEQGKRVIYFTASEWTHELDPLTKQWLPRNDEVSAAAETLN